LHWDSDIAGFGYRLRAGSNPTWVFQHRVGRKQRRITIGAATAISAKDARATAAGLYHRTKLGQDPAGDKAKAVQAQGETFKAALDIYLNRQAERLRPRSYVEVRRHLAVHAIPLHHLPLASIDRRTVAKLFAKLGDESGPVAANRTRASCAAFLAWAMREGIADSNPIIGTNKAPERSRDRVLTNDELRKLWTATAGSDQHSAIVRLLLLTGCRREEIGGLAWQEIDFDRALITLPAARVKNARPFDLPLSDTAVEILKAQPRRAGRDYIFGEGPSRGFRGWSQGKVALDQRASIAAWHLHDLRRTAATGMADIGILPHVIEAALNHQSGAKAGIAGIYNRASYANEKRQALDRWAEHVLAIVEGRDSKIVSLRR
jgi:integrase